MRRGALGGDIEEYRGFRRSLVSAFYIEMILGNFPVPIKVFGAKGQGFRVWVVGYRVNIE